jgi:hypothetical protein
VKRELVTLRGFNDVELKAQMLNSVPVPNISIDVELSIKSLLFQKPFWR